jgi:hypothetical protein
MSEEGRVIRNKKYEIRKEVVEIKSGSGRGRDLIFLMVWIGGF